MKKRIVISLALLALVICAPTGLSSQESSQESSESSRKIATRVTPQYPILARNMRIQGSVRADVLVAANGKVRSLEMKGGHPLLVQAAQNALREWKWEPSAHETHEFVELRFAP